LDKPTSTYCYAYTSAHLAYAHITSSATTATCEYPDSNTHETPTPNKHAIFIVTVGIQDCTQGSIPELALR